MITKQWANLEWHITEKSNWHGHDSFSNDIYVEFQNHLMLHTVQKIMLSNQKRL